MELAASQETPLKLPPKKTDAPSTPDKLRKPKPKDMFAANTRRAKRRRATAGGDDFNVNFSKIKISESNRVLRSRSKCSNSSSLDNSSDVPHCPQTDAVSKDHSYSKASKRSSKSREPTTSSPPTVHLKVFIDLTSNEDSSYERFEGSSKGIDAFANGCQSYRRSNKIEIIDFDDLELSNSCYEDHDSKFEHNCNDAESAENMDVTEVPEQQTHVVTSSSSPTIPENPPCRGSDNDRGHQTQDQCKPGTGDDSDQNFNPRTDFEKLLAKYGDADIYLAKNASFLEQSHWMLESAINPNSEIERPRLSNEETSPSPVYLDLDQNRVRISSPQRIGVITQASKPSEGPTIVSPMNFPSGGCFQRLGPVTTSTPTRPVASISEYYNAVVPNCVTMDESRSHQGLQMLAEQCESPSESLPAPTPTVRPSLTGFPNFQTVFAHKIASLIRSKSNSSELSPDTVPNPHVESRSNPIPSSFSTSGGSIERIFSPVIPKQPSSQKKYHGISVPFEERNDAVANMMPESAQFDAQNGQQPECRIHLVDTPPSFTRPCQPELSQSRPQIDGDGPSILMAQQEPIELGRLDASHLKASIKPKRTRRTRAQMEIYRQEMARTCTHRSKRSQRFTSRTASHILGRNFSMEYRRVHNSHPQEFIYSGLPARFSSYLRPAAVQQQRYSETYSVNETNLFGVASNGSDWSQTFDPFPSFSHGVAEFRSFEPLWTMSPGIRNLSSFSSTDTGPHVDAGDSYQEFYSPSVGSASNPSSFMWNQQVRSIQMQSAFGNVQQVPAVNSRLLTTSSRRPFTPWQLEQISSNLTDVSSTAPINPMQFF